MIDLGAQPRTRYARSDGVEIAYQTIGDGPADVVLVPGVLSHVSLWWEHPAFGALFDGLATRARLIMFDRRGAGLSGGNRVPTIDERVRDVEAVMNAAGAARATIVGPSEGAPAAALFASIRPERCSGLILYGAQAAGLCDEEYPWGVDAEELELVLKSLAMDWGGGSTLHLYAPTLAADETAVRWWARMEQQGIRAGHVEAAMRAMAHTDVRDLLPLIPVPTLVAHCVGDLVAPVDGARFIAERIPGAQLSELPGMDHLPVLSAGSALIEAMEAFIDSVPDAEAPRERVAAVVAVVDPSSADAPAAAFDGPVAAVTHAVAVRDAARRRGEEVRVAVHLDRASLSGPRITGPAADTAWRLAHAAGDDEILVSRSVSRLLAAADVELEPYELPDGGPPAPPVFALRAR